MSGDFEYLSEALNESSFAQNLAVDEARREQAERIRSMSLEEQAAAMNGMVAGMKVSIANPKAAMPKPARLEVYRASELYGKQLERTRMIVPGMIPSGLTVLAGAPKRGKSWLALSLALSVASGGMFLGIHCTQGDVLYLDLESRQYRVQDRLSKLIIGAAPESLYIAHKAEPLGVHLYEQLDAWTASVKSPSLIIIDTLGRVKGAGRGRENAYEADTRQYGALQSWATEHKLAVVVVHHLRKVKDSDDWFDKINGSNGLVGAADAVIGLGGARGEQVSKLMVSGRDIDGDYSMAIRFDGGRWLLESSDSERYEEESAYNSSQLIQGVYALMLDRSEWQGTINELLDAIVDVTQLPLNIRSTAQAGRELQRFQALLYEREGLLVGYRRTSSRRVLFIRNTRKQGSINDGDPADQQEGSQG